MKIGFNNKLIINLRIITKNHEAVPEIAFRTKSISKLYGRAMSMPTALELMLYQLEDRLYLPRRYIGHTNSGVIICKSVGVFCPGSVAEHPESHSRVKKDIETIGTFVQIITIVLSFVLIFFLLEKKFFATLT